jgi:hypothetical protein
MIFKVKRCQPTPDRHLLWFAWFPVWVSAGTMGCWVWLEWVYYERHHVMTKPRAILADKDIYNYTYKLRLRPERLITDK